jgi:hypothetical protein
VIQYESKVIYEFAGRLYRTADSIVLTYTGFGVIAGLALGGFTAGAGAAIVGGAILGGIRWWIGTQKAFALKLLAQTSLCQVQIEENTRSRGVPGGSLPNSVASRTAV